MTRVGAARGRVVARQDPPTLPAGYLEQSELPLTSLAFLLPFIIIYELGTHYFATDPWNQTEHRIIAFQLMQRFFHWFGATGRFLPAMAIVGILLAWHIARRDPWVVRPATLTGMAVEATAWAVPLLLVGMVAVKVLNGLVQPLAAPVSESWRAMLVLAIGAGLYEELIFRLAAFTLLSLLLCDMLGMTKRVAYPLMVVVSAVGFALYHYLGAEAFDWQTFAFRTFAGVYFGGLLLVRGFGITSFSHAAYDVCVVLMRFLLPVA